MDLALPYVTANLCALFIVGFLIVTEKSRSGRLRQAAVSRTRKQALETQAAALAKTRSQVQTQTRARDLARARDQVRVRQQAAKVTNPPAPEPSSAHRPVAEPRITGAGVMLIQKRDNDLTVILFKEGQTFTDPGGTRVNETVHECASRELEEESIGMFLMDVSRVNAYPVKHVEYQGIFVAIECDSPDSFNMIYDKNLDYVRTELPGIDPVWMETSGVDEFFISDIQDIPQSSAPSNTDTYAVENMQGQAVQVSDRVVGLVREATRNGTLARIATDFTENRAVQMRIGANPEGIGKRGTPMRASTQNMVVCWSVRS